MPSYKVISEPACRWDRNEGQIESGVLGGFRETVRTQRNANQEFLESKVRLNAIKNDSRNSQNAKCDSKISTC